MFLANECNLNRVKEYLALSFTIAHILKKHIEIHLLDCFTLLAKRGFGKI